MSLTIGAKYNRDNLAELDRRLLRAAVAAHVNSAIIGSFAGRHSVVMVGNQAMLYACWEAVRESSLAIRLEYDATEGAWFVYDIGGCNA